MRDHSVYVTTCSDCGAKIETPTAEVTCVKCGLQIRIEWQWNGEVQQ
jgi:DNA-directed RNA polymerase subunit RPC12/RpoP